MLTTQLAPGELMSIEAVAGAGKSMALREYAARRPQHDFAQSTLHRTLHRTRSGCAAAASAAATAFGSGGGVTSSSLLSPSRRFRRRLASQQHHLAQRSSWR